MSNDLNDRTHPVNREALHRYLCTARDAAERSSPQRATLILELDELKRLVELVKADNVERFDREDQGARGP